MGSEVELSKKPLHTGGPRGSRYPFQCCSDTSGSPAAGQSLTTAGPQRARPNGTTCRGRPRRSGWPGIEVRFGRDSGPILRTASLTGPDPDCGGAQTVHLRLKRRLGPVSIADLLGTQASTVHAVLVRCRLNRLSHLDRVTGERIRRYEHERPGTWSTSI
jgi:hypothetical protein